jgi:hypothetical protein
MERKYEKCMASVIHIKPFILGKYPMGERKLITQKIAENIASIDFQPTCVVDVDGK